jgi:replication-associated recombination protein RarA
MSYPNDLACQSGQKSKVKLIPLQSLKRSVERFYNKRDRFLEKQESLLTETQKKKISRSTCFNLRDAEMHLNFVLQLHEKKSHICLDHLKKMVDSVEKLIDFKSEEHIFLKNSKHKLELIDQSTEIISYLEVVKTEIGLL